MTSLFGRRRSVPSSACPSCSGPLTWVNREPPWCGRCEWNLNAFVARRGSPWGGMIGRWDHRFGFRADRSLPGLASSGKLDGSAGGKVLLAVSLLLFVLPVAAVAGALALFFDGRGWAIAVGVVLLLVAWTLRPRFGSLRKVAKYCYRPKPEHLPTLREVINRVADATGAPRPAVLLLSEEFNAGAGHFGLRRKPVLILGIPLLVTVEPDELVGLLAHELGHLDHLDSRYGILTQPALTLFGRLARAVRPRGRASGLLALVMLVWRLVGGLLSRLLWSIHLGLNILGAARSRRQEVRADLAAAQVSGTAAMMRMVDVMATLPLLTGQVTAAGVAPGRAVATWRARIRYARRKVDLEEARVRRQYSIRDGASLFGSHPAAGRRHQALSAVPPAGATVTVGPDEAAWMDAELGPFAEALRQALAQR